MKNAAYCIAKDRAKAESISMVDDLRDARLRHRRSSLRIFDKSATRDFSH